MKTSESTKLLTEALTKCKFKSPPKSKVVDYTYNGKRTHYAYASLDQIIESTDTELKKNGLALTQGTGFDASNFGLFTRLSHVSGEWQESFMPLETRDQSPQDIGAQLTYFRRYQWVGMIGIEAEEDTDGLAARPESPSAPVRPDVATKPLPPPSGAQLPNHAPTGLGGAADYVPKFGKFQNVPLGRIPLNELANYASFLRKDGKKPKPIVAEFLQKVDELSFVAADPSKWPEPPPIDPNDELPYT